MRLCASHYTVGCFIWDIVGTRERGKKKKREFTYTPYRICILHERT